MKINLSFFLKLSFFLMGLCTGVPVFWGIYYYGYDKDLIVYPAGAQETGAEGLLYAWDMENRKFVEEPVL
ncbi:hypothetical protein D7V83_09510 [bacterium 0.1xD8-71]|nr:hypothetical protein D7V83_09510 [bacterium 0.1xD8-71]